MEFLNKNIYRDKVGIYCVENIINNKRYIGQASHNFYSRFASHSSLLKHNKHYNKLLQDDYNLYGDDCFIFKVLEVTNNVNNNELETDYIQKEILSGHAYNIVSTGHVGNIEKIKKASRNRTTIVLNEKIVKNIKELFIKGASSTSISQDLNINWSTINNIRLDFSWKDVYVDGWDDFQKNGIKRVPKDKLTKKEKLLIYNDRKNGMSARDVESKYHRSRKTIRKIMEEFDN